MYVISLCQQGDANRSYSDDDRSSCNFYEDDKQKDSLHLSGIYVFCYFHSTFSFQVKSLPVYLLLVVQSVHLFLVGT